MENSRDKNSIFILEQGLTVDERKQIILGLDQVLLEISKDNKYQINVQKVDFKPCDFQLDGLYWASRDWLSKALNVKLLEPEISYDSSLDRYIFNLAVI